MYHQPAALRHPFSPQLPDGCGESDPRRGYLEWAVDLHSLLSDPTGVSLFKEYLEEEGAADPLDFLFACNGLRKQAATDQPGSSAGERVAQIVRVIYRRYFLKTQLDIDEELRKEVHKRIKEGRLDSHVFDEAYQSVENFIKHSVYPNFLRSEVYLQHVQASQGSTVLLNGTTSRPGGGGGGGGGESCSRVAAGEAVEGSGGGTGGGGGTGLLLATLHEDRELDMSPPSYPPLTRDMLYMTQERRAANLRPKTEAFAGSLYRGGGGGGAGGGGSGGISRLYSSYNPVSRQDSELQSLSSDARTESDNLSLTDSSIDGSSQNYGGGGGSCSKMSRKQYQRHIARVRESAAINRDPPHVSQTLIPRTQRILTDKVYPMNPEQFAAILIKKLESVKRSQEIQEKLAHKLVESTMSGGGGSSGGPSAKSLADAIRERFQLDDDNNDQHILDQHVSRVWSDLTPATRSPGGFSSPPRPKSPTEFRRSRQNQPMNKILVTGSGVTGSSSGSHQTVPHPYQSSRLYPGSSSRHPRKDKDVFSTFSSDSGNVSESLDHHRLHLPKSKSMPDYTTDFSSYSSLPGDEMGRRTVGCAGGGGGSHTGGGRQRYSSKKPTEQLTDSGVSVVSESPSNPGSLPPPHKDRVMSWLRESDRSLGCCSHSERDSATSSSCPSTSGGTSRHHQDLSRHSHRGRRTPPPPSGGSGNYPGTDSCALLHQQAEELRRRLDMEQARCNKQSRQQRCSSSGGVSSSSCGPTLSRKGAGGSTSGAGEGGAGGGYTTVVFSFCDEQFPYRSKIPGHSITLRQFKEFLPKKGNYRYFFKTECEELDMQVIQEEIMDDNEVLPLWEGKVMAQVKPILD